MECHAHELNHYLVCPLHMDLDYEIPVIVAHVLKGNISEDARVVE